MSNYKKRMSFKEAQQKFCDKPGAQIVTQARVLKGKFAAKSFELDASTQELEKKSFDAGHSFYMNKYHLTGIGSLSEFLQWTSEDKQAFVLLGVKKVEGNRPVRRKKYGDDAPMDEIPTRILPIDLDNEPLPEWVDYKNDPHRAIAYLVSRLPACLQNTSFWWQFSSSAGVEQTHLKARLWFWLDRPWEIEDLRVWGRAHNETRGYMQIDTAPFNGVQPVYTASPEFVGMDDPIGQRTGFCKGSKHEVTLPKVQAAQVYINKVDDAKRARRAAERAASGEKISAADLCVQEWIEAIGGAQGFHVPIRSAIACYIKTRKPIDCNELEIFGMVRDAVSRSASQRSVAEIKRYTSDVYLGDLFQGGQRKYTS